MPNQRHRPFHHTHGDPGAPGRSALQVELVEHMPFSVSAVALGLTFAGLICYLAPEVGSEAAHLHEGRIAGGRRESLISLFHLFHPMHMFFSATATTAMFWRYDRKALKAIAVGLIGAVGVCGVSDIVVPQMALFIMHVPAEWHICVIEHPELVFPFALVGVLTGLGAAGRVAGSTFFSHSLHVLSSTMASIFYLIAPFVGLAWIDDVGKIFIFVILAVMVPCCLSDIVFPLAMTKEARAKALAEAHAH